ncbi:MAG: hypothetical protein GEU28_13185 [Dehalococcoidia bacterium]|nr:hypothetical protein [Dehalococcoidia bacterium]
MNPYDLFESRTDLEGFEEHISDLVESIMFSRPSHQAFYEAWDETGTRWVHNTGSPVSRLAHAGFALQRDAVKVAINLAVLATLHLARADGWEEDDAKEADRQPEPDSAA